MEHPLINNLDSLTAEQLLDKISELNKKFNIAQSTGNGHLCNQISMAIESHRNRYMEKTRPNNGNDNFDGVIDIS
jgi:hypothetical protein